MATTSKRETILEYLRNTTMELIDKTGNYNLNLSLISRTFLMPEDVKDDKFPSVFILDDFRTAYTWLTNFEYTTGSSRGSLSDGMLVGLMGYIKIQDPGKFDVSGPLSTECNKMHSDLILAMHDDTSLGGAVLGLQLLSSHNVIDLPKKFVGAVFQLYAIKYDFSPAGGVS